MTHQTKWLIDTAHSEISFKIRHLMIANIKGSFKTFDANIYTTGEDFTTASINLWIETSSVNTGDEKRDEHLNGPDFFNSQKHKQIAFVSRTTRKEGPDGKHELLGDLNLKGITKKIKLSVQFGGIINDPWGNKKAGFTITGKIARSDWGFVWNTFMRGGDLILGDEVTILCELELTKVSEKELALELEEAASKIGSPSIDLSGPGKKY